MEPTRFAGPPVEVPHIGSGQRPLALVERTPPNEADDFVLRSNREPPLKPREVLALEPTRFAGPPVGVPQICSVQDSNL